MCSLNELDNVRERLYELLARATANGSRRELDVPTFGDIADAAPSMRTTRTTTSWSSTDFLTPPSLYLGIGRQATSASS